MSPRRRVNVLDVLRRDSQPHPRYGHKKYRGNRKAISKSSQEPDSISSPLEIQKRKSKNNYVNCLTGGNRTRATVNFCIKSRRLDGTIRVHFTMYSGFMTALALFGAALSASAVMGPPRNDLSSFGLGLSGPSSLTTCGTSGEASCQNTTVQTDFCCFESPGVCHWPR